MSERGKLIEEMARSGEDRLEREFDFVLFNRYSDAFATAAADVLLARVVGIGEKEKQDELDSVRENRSAGNGRSVLEGDYATTRITDIATRIRALMEE